MRILPALALLALAAWGQTSGTDPGDRPHIARDPDPASADDLSYSFGRPFNRPTDQVEVGGRYAGAEFHGRALPSRISLYYPVANSIDLSTDYWKRGESQPMSLRLRAGGSEVQLGEWSCTVSPHAARFEAAASGVAASLAYEFSLDDPAMVVTMKFTNGGRREIALDLLTQLRMTLRTCQTYARLDSARTNWLPAAAAVTASYGELAAGPAEIFIGNGEGGERPSSWSAAGEDLGEPGGYPAAFPEKLSGLIHPALRGKAGAAFLYRRRLAPGDSMTVVQFIGSSRPGEAAPTAKRIAARWKEEVDAYDNYVRVKAERSSFIVLGDDRLDRSAVYAKGILAANAHYIDNRIVPMPCPAEYNFFFTHDLLMTDLAAVNFDPGRVKRDLLYVADHSNDSVIPHAYYWRDDGFKTEYCTPDNWNHFWFVLVTASYLRHSFDDSTARVLMPFVSKSMREILSQEGSDHLMHAYRPDWWDIGHIDGPRAYTTTLAIRAIREYLYLASALGLPAAGGFPAGSLPALESRADAMEEALNTRLWSDSARYFMNYNAGIYDPHYYMGSLLAGAFGYCRGKSDDLLATASRELMAEGVGIRTAMPADFAFPAVIDFYKFHGDEAGQPYYYINGGVWPHSNAWYALALLEGGKREEALHFVRSTMTVEGIMASPMGEPAMYEYRYTDPSSPEYGKIDKPSFLWAGGFYLKALYALAGLRENEWNLSVTRPAKGGRYSLTFGNEKEVTVPLGSPSGLRVRGGVVIPSLVIPLSRSKDWELAIDTSGSTPVLLSVNAIVHDVVYNRAARRLTAIISSFEGHTIIASISAPAPPSGVHIGGRDVPVSSSAGVYTIRATASSGEQTLEFTW